MGLVRHSRPVHRTGSNADRYAVAMTDPRRPDLPGEPARDADERQRRFKERARPASIEGAEEDSIPESDVA